MIGNFDLLFPDFFEGTDPIIPRGTKYDSLKVHVDTPKVYSPAKQVSYLLVEPPTDFVGSNNWAVLGSKTQSGKPILCNDPHLKLSLPSIWYEVQLNAPGVNVYGVSLPGTPSVIIGFNDSIAWGVTNASVDVRDWYEMRAYRLDEDEGAAHGHLAAATSTGGMTNKRFGRIGDSPVIGAGTYANNKTCAISCTGHGEYFLRYVARSEEHTSELQSH